MRGGQARTQRGMLGMGKSRKDSDRRVNGKTTRANEGGEIKKREKWSRPQQDAVLFMHNNARISFCFH